MRYDNSLLVFSPSDLIVYLSGDFASWMDRWYLERENSNGVANELGLPLGVMLDGVTCVPDGEDEELTLIAAKANTESESTLAANVAIAGSSQIRLTCAVGVIDYSKMLRGQPLTI